MRGGAHLGAGAVKVQQRVQGRVHVQDHVRAVGAGRRVAGRQHDRLRCVAARLVLEVGHRAALRVADDLPGSA